MLRPVGVVTIAIAVPLLLSAGLAGGNWASQLGHSEAARSREAAERPCELAYVRPAATHPAGVSRLALSGATTSGPPLEQPLTIAFPPSGGTGVLGERQGLVRRFDGITVGEPVLDFTEDTLETGDGGLLAATYDPAGEWLYLYRTRADNTDVVAAYPVTGSAPDPTGERIIIELDHPTSDQHHGGGLAFGPDGHLYIGTGDGGGFGDPDGNAQRLDVLLGKLLRLEPTPAAETDGDRPYRVPGDNPFVGHPDARPEVFAYGLRNPYRIWFDEPTGDLWIADVGQFCWEEINRLPGGGRGGENFEWDLREGTHRFQGGHAADGVEPIVTFAHRDGWCGVIGGFTYRGTAIAGLDGVYLFTDFCAGRITAVRDRPGRSVELIDLGVGVDEPISLLPGPDGEPWVLSIDGSARRIVTTANRWPVTRPIVG